MILLIDNYDSFVHNLARYCRRLGQETHVVRNDCVSTADIATWSPAAIVMSPGPCAPLQAGCCLTVVKELHTRFPMLGVCLGHQVIAEALGGEVVRAREPVHGKASLMSHSRQGVFAGIPSPVRVGRYHSLEVRAASLPASLRVDAALSDGTIMAIAHRDFPVVGWQFHPESVLTDQGYRMLANFLRLAGVEPHDCQRFERNELVTPLPDQPDWFQRAVEFPGGRSSARKAVLPDSRES